MSDEGVTPENTEETAVTTENVTSTEAGSNNESLREKFRLTGDEEILKDVKPSIFAFIPMYLIALIVLGAHMLFGI